MKFIVTDSIEKSGDDGICSECGDDTSSVDRMANAQSEVFALSALLVLGYTFIFRKKETGLNK